MVPDESSCGFRFFGYTKGASALNFRGFGFMCDNILLRGQHFHMENPYVPFSQPERRIKV
jgi:hypothetical protein